MTVPKLVTVSFSGLKRRKGCKNNETGAEGSLFPYMMTMRGKLNKIPARAALVCGDVELARRLSIHLFCKCRGLSTPYQTLPTVLRVTANRKRQPRRLVGSNRSHAVLTGCTKVFIQYSSPEKLTPPLTVHRAHPSARLFLYLRQLPTSYVTRTIVVTPA